MPIGNVNTVTASRARIGQRQWRQVGGWDHRSNESARDMNHYVKAWLLKIADAIEQWPGGPQDARVTTPAGVAGRMMNRDVPSRLRTGVARALPLLNTRDFAEAARLIRTAAGLEL